MRKFSWRLQRLLGIKKIEEQKKRAELIGLTEKLAQAQSGLLIKKAVLRNTIAGIAAKNPQQRLSEQEFCLKCSRVNDLEIEELKNKVIDLQTQQRRKIAEVIEAKRFKEGLEKLRAKAKIEFIRHHEKIEQKEMDEDASLSFARKMRDVK